MSVLLGCPFHLVGDLFEGGHPPLFIGESGRQEIQGASRPAERVRDNFNGQNVRKVVGSGPVEFGRWNCRMDVQFAFSDVQVDLVTRIKFCWSDNA